MPGISLAVNHSPDIVKNTIEKTTIEGYELNILLNDQSKVFLASNAAESYPVLFWERGNNLIVFEGLTYPFNSKLIEKELFNCFSPERFDLNRLKNWVRNNDGEFVILLINRLIHQAVFANDRFGRLPVYMVKEGRKLIITREIGVAKQLRTIPQNDIEGHAQHLLFGYTLGNKTLWDRVERINPGSQIQIDLINGRSFSSEIPFISEMQSGKSKFNSSELIKSLSESIDNRINTLTNPALSLSGGLDSRLIAGLLKSLGRSIPFLTYSDKSLSAQHDKSVALQIAERLDFLEIHRIVDLPEVSQNNIFTLSRIKHGLNGSDMAFLIPFLEEFRKNRFTMMTGDGGDKTLDDLRSPVRMLSYNHLVHVLIRKHGSFPIDLVSKITGQNKENIFDSIAEVLKSYGSISLEERFIQFMIRERAMNWLFEGEDRNRHFVWTTTPYYNHTFFDQAMRLPMSEKAHGKLFTSLFKQVPGLLHNLNNPNWDCSPDQTNKIQRLYLKQSIKYLLPSLLIKNRKPGDFAVTLEDFSFSSKARFVQSDFNIFSHIKEIRDVKLMPHFWMRIYDLARNSD